MTIINKGIFDTADVFLRQTGNDWPTAQVLSTSDITEGANLYFTNARVYSNVITLLPTLAGSGIQIQANGQINATSSATSGFATTANVANTVLSISNFTTANLAEGLNLYYTNARVVSAVLPYLTTSNVAEGSNLYYTNARVYAAIAGNLATKANVTDLTTANVLESNTALYYTNARVNSFIQGNLATKANVTDLTTANVSELTNLYYTNARVYSNVIALLPTLAGSGITIQANGQISASTATVSLAGLTTSNLAEGNNLYYTNARALSAFSEGSGIAISSGGVISARGDSAGSGLFNSGIQLVGNTLAQSTFSNVKVFTTTEGNTFIGYSFHVTNITSNIVYLTGRHVFDANTTLFANLLEMPVGSSMEVFRKPQVFRANDIIQIQGFDQNRTAVNNGISSYLSYQATVDDTYQRAGNTVTSNALTTIYQTVGRVSIFESINLVNLSPNVIYGTVIVTDGSDNIVAYLAANLAIPAYASVDVCEYPKTLLDDYKIKVQKSDNFNPLSVFTSSKYTQSFAVTPSSTNMTESGTITLDLVTTNIVNGTVLYYAITGVSGNINQTDFVTNTTGTVIVQNNAARLTLQANADLNTNFEGDETFTVVYRKNSNVGTVVATSSSIVLRDTSNVTSYTLTDNTGGTGVLESSTIIFTLSTINLPPNTTYYYNSNGTVISSYFTAGNTGSFISNANTTYNIVFAGAGSIPDMTSATFNLEIRSGSLTGPILATSNTVTIVDAALADIQATGGNIIVDSGYKVHTYTTSGNLTVSSVGTSGNIEYLVIGGGGGGGSGYPGFNGVGSGGGAGGYLTGNTTLSTAGTYIITVGSGGGTTPNGARGTTGNDSNIFNPALSIISLGGGGGGGSPSNGTQSGIPGGSGGGGNPAGSGTPGQGNSGGAGTQNDYGGGGGGANTAGGGGFVQLGGTGRSSSITGTSVIRAGGGSGGGSPNAGSPAASAGGGGGAGGFGATVGGTGTVNTGGGGGGGGNGSVGGSGGSGIVIIRYPYTAESYNITTSNISASNTTVDNSNLVYNLQTINVANATTLYWTLTGNVLNSDVIGGNTGSFTVINSNANITIALANNIVTGNATKVFALQIRKVSTTGTVAATGPTTNVVTNANYVTATGGDFTYIINGYKTHVFKTSGTLTINGTGTGGNKNIQYLAVGGGGGGSSNSPAVSAGGGGGAGAIVQGNTSSFTAGTFSMIVGAGAAASSGGNGGSPGAFVYQGGNTALLSNVIFAYGGGGAGCPGYGDGQSSPQASGGGAGQYYAGPSGVGGVGAGVLGQGFPGGGNLSAPNNYSAGGGGAGEAGEPGSTGKGGNGYGISWLTESIPSSSLTSVGTSGPVANVRYFAGGGMGALNNGGANVPSAGRYGGGGGGSVGTTNTGGGGGGRSGYTQGFAGGSGIIIIRYPYV